LEGFAARAMFQVLIVSRVSTNVELLSAFSTRSWMENNGGKAW
jgi:hypothetical protein